MPKQICLGIYMNVLSLFDGISVARYALDVAGIPVNNYYSSEIDKNAIAISRKNYPLIIRCGSVLDLSASMIPEPIDILIGGSPCQDLSIAKKDRKGLEGERSGLFWEYVRIMNEVKPKWFILENVASMPQADKDIISGVMGVEPIMFNASLVSAQCRKRLFWTNIPFQLPDDKGILLKHILETDGSVNDLMVNKDKKAYTLTSSYAKVSASENQIKNSIAKKQRTMINSDSYKIARIVGRRLNAKGKRDDYNKDIPIEQQIEIRDDDKSGTLTTVQKDNMVVYSNLKINETAQTGRVETKNLGFITDKDHQANRFYDVEGKLPALSVVCNSLVKQNYTIRKLTEIECERLQSLPDNYTQGVAKTHRYKCLGNAFNAQVIAHILSFIK